MPRTLEQWIDAEQKKINAIHSNITRAKVEELVENVRELQKTRPRRYRWKRKTQAARGYKSLHQSIKIDHAKLETWTDHPQGREFQETGGNVSPKRKRFMTVVVKNWTPGKSGFVAVPGKNGNMVIVHAKRKSAGIYALLLKKAHLPPNRWVQIAKDATDQGGAERIADKVYDARG